MHHAHQVLGERLYPLVWQQLQARGNAEPGEMAGKITGMLLQGVEVGGVWCVSLSLAYSSCGAAACWLHRLDTVSGNGRR
jgi:hypothetical protein